MVEHLDRALAEHGVDVVSVTGPTSLAHGEHAVLVLGDGGTRLRVLQPIEQRERLRTVVHLGPLGRTNSDLMEAVRKAVDSIEFPGDEEGKAGVARD